MSFKYLPLGDICNVRRGTTITKQQTTSGIVPVVGGGTKPTYFHSMPNRESGCITVSGSGASAGFVNYWSEPIFASDCSTVEPSNDNQDRRFIYFFLLANQDYIYSNFRSGAAQPHVYAKDIATLEYPILDLSHQQKIVERLDAIFAEIDRATAAAEANIKNAEALFQSYLNQVFEENFSNKKKLKDCCHIKPPKSETKALNPDDEVSFMPMEALGINEKFAIPNQVRKLSDVSGSYTYFAEGDVLLAKITPCFENGKLGIAKDLINRVGFGSSEYIVFRPGIELDSSWLYYFLNRSEFRNNGAKHMSGAVGHKRVTKEFIEDLVIPLPPVLRQSEIISEIENISNITKSLKSSNSHKLIELNQLKQSILNQAFNNELVKE